MDEISSEEFIKHGIQKQLDEHVQSTLQVEKELVKEQLESLAAQERDLQANLSKLVNQRLDQEKKKMREEVGKEFQNVIETNREELKQKSIELRRMRELEDEAERLKREHKDALHLVELNAKKSARLELDVQVQQAREALKSEHELEVMDLEKRLENRTRPSMNSSAKRSKGRCRPRARPKRCSSSKN